VGLDTTHDCWHGAYSAFNRWRNKLALSAGYMLYKHGAGGPGIDADLLIYESALIDWGLVRAKELEGDWDAIPVRIDGTPDPLLLLLAHYDCEGYLKVEHLEPLALRLQELLPSLGDDEGGGHIGLYREKTQTFIDGLRKAAEARERVEFH